MKSIDTPVSVHPVRHIFGPFNYHVAFGNACGVSVLGPFKAINMCEVSCSTICFLVSFVIFAFIDLHIVQGNMHVSHRCPAKKHCLMTMGFWTR